MRGRARKNITDFSYAHNWVNDSDGPRTVGGSDNFKALDRRTGIGETVLSVSTCCKRVHDVIVLHLRITDSRRHDAGRQRTDPRIHRVAKCLVNDGHSYM